MLLATENQLSKFTSLMKYPNLRSDVLFFGERESVAERESAVGSREEKNLFFSCLLLPCEQSLCSQGSLLPTADSRAATLSRSPKKRTPDRRLEVSMQECDNVKSFSNSVFFSLKRNFL